MSVKDKLADNHIVIEFINNIIDEHYPKENAPEWVIYDIFRKKMFGYVLDNMITNLEDKWYEYSDHNLALAYTSDNIDTGTGRMHSAVDDECTIRIPIVISVLYDNIKRN